jgi:hypothetical protein
MKKQLIGAMITIKDTLENDYNRIFKAYVSFSIKIKKIKIVMELMIILILLF